MEVADSLSCWAILLAYLLSGKRPCEYTNASTTQLGTRTRAPGRGSHHAVGLPRRLRGPVGGQVLGPLRGGCRFGGGLAQGIP